MIKLNDNLRRNLTKSLGSVTLTQVTDSGGFGSITTSNPSPGNLVLLTWHPRINGKLHLTGFTLGNCGLGKVLASLGQNA